MTFLQANLAALERIAPKLVAALVATEPPRCSPILGADDRISPEVDGRLIVSAYDQAREAQHQAGAIGSDPRQQTWCYGVGMGELPRALLARPDTDKLVVVLLSLPIFRMELELADHTDWLRSGRVLVVHGTPGSKVYGPCAVVGGELRYADATCERLRDDLVIHLNRRFHRVQFLSQAKNDQAHEAISLREFAEDENVRVVIERTPAPHRAIICAGGPTLDEEIGWLARQKGDPIIAVSTALSCLVRAGIVPTFVVIIDPHPSQVDHLEGVDLEKLRETMLIYDRVVTPEIMRRWPGPRAWGTMGTSLELCDLWADGTVTHPAVDLARRLGAISVVLLGADFCNAHGRSHHQGLAECHDVAPEGLPVTADGNGVQVTTTSKLIHYRRMLERYIEAFPGIRFYKRGRAGVPLEGATWLD